MAVDIGPKIGIDGEAQFRKQLNDINQALKTMGAEQKAVASAFQDEADAEKKMAAQKDVLNRQIEAQREKLSLLEKGLRESAAMYGEADSKTQKWQQAVHEATAQLNNMNGQLNGMDGTIEDTAEALGDAEEATSGWADVMKGHLLADAVKAGLSKVYDLVKNIGGAMWDASKAGAAYADDVLTMATVSGMNVEQLQEYKYMADLVDVSVDTITGSMTKLTSSMTKAQKGNKETKKAFKELGVAIKDESGNLRDNQDVFNDAIAALSKIDNETERDAKAMQLMGKSAKELNPLMAAGADRLRELAQEAHDTGYVLSGSALDALGKQQDAMDRLDKKTEALSAKKAELAEAISLCNHILEYCTDDELRDETKKTMCDIYSHQLGNVEMALDIAEKLHSMSYSKEIVKATVLTGDVAFNQAQINIMDFADNMWWHMYNIACVPDISEDNYTTDQKIEIMQRGIALLEVIFDGNYLYFNDRLANSYRQLAMLYLVKGDRDAALLCIERMAQHAILFDSLPEKSKYSSVLLNTIEYCNERDNQSAPTLCAKLLKGRFGSRIWSSIRNNERFVAAVDSMSRSIEEK